MVGHHIGHRVAFLVGLWALAGGLIVFALPSFGAGVTAGAPASPSPAVTLSPQAPPPLTITGLTVQPNPVSQGQQFTVTVTASGGVPPYSYSWNPVPPGCFAGTSSSWQCSVGQTGTYPIDVKVTDQNGTQVSGSQTLTVTSSGGSGGSGNNGGNSSKNNNGSFNLSSFGPFLTYALIGAIVSFALLVALTVGVLVIAVILARRLPRLPKGGITCGSCQTTIPPGSKFCPNCAAPIAPPK